VLGLAGDDDLLARVVQGVEGLEELLLGAFLVLQELDVVHQEHIQQVLRVEGDLQVLAVERRLGRPAGTSR
jgi:hypothetical protein